jgi:hypothetical protein
MGAVFRRIDTGTGPVHESTGKFPFAAGERHYPMWSEPIRDQVVYRDCMFDGCDLSITEREYHDYGVSGLLWDEYHRRAGEVLDLGIVRDPPEASNKFAVFMERFEGLVALPCEGCTPPCPDCGYPFDSTDEDVDIPRLFDCPECDWCGMLRP